MGSDRVKMVPMFLTSAGRGVVVPSAHIGRGRGGKAGSTGGDELSVSLLRCMCLWETSADKTKWIDSGIVGSGANEKRDLVGINLSVRTAPEDKERMMSPRKIVT